MDCHKFIFQFKVKYCLFVLNRWHVVVENKNFRWIDFIFFYAFDYCSIIYYYHNNIIIISVCYLLFPFVIYFHFIFILLFFVIILLFQHSKILESTNKDLYSSNSTWILQNGLGGFDFDYENRFNWLLYERFTCLWNYKIVSKSWISIW